jgi:hypothetical protein
VRRGDLAALVSNKVVSLFGVYRLRKDSRGRRFRADGYSSSRLPAPLGPLINEAQLKNVDRIVSETVALGAAIQTGSVERGRHVADQLRTGIVHINDQTLNNDAYAPFGGTGASGNGARFGTQSSWNEFTQWQWLTVREQAHGFPF